MLPNDDGRQACEKWVEDHAGELYALAYRLCGRVEAAEELVQETFYHAWRSIGTLQHSSRARAWLFQILRYRHAHWIRDSGRRPQTTGEVDATDRPDRRVRSPLEKIAHSDALEQALAHLDRRYKEPFLMVFVEGKSCRETAESLDLPVGTVLSRTHRARRALKRALAATEGLHSDGHARRADRLTPAA